MTKMRRARAKIMGGSQADVPQAVVIGTNAPDANYQPPPLRRQIHSSIVRRAFGLVVIQNAIGATMVNFAMAGLLGYGPAPEFLALLPTLLMATIASLLALYAARQMVQFPGSSIASYFPVCLALSFLILASIVVLLRIDYSRVTLVASIFGALIWLGWDYYFNRRKKALQILLVPGGELRNIGAIKNVELHLLKHPADHIVAAEIVVADLHYNHSPTWERYIAKCVLAGIPVFDVKGLI